jgi:hypothetical protein
MELVLTLFKLCSFESLGDESCMDVTKLENQGSLVSIDTREPWVA